MLHSAVKIQHTDLTIHCAVGVRQFGHTAHIFLDPKRTVPSLVLGQAVFVAEPGAHRACAGGESPGA